MKFRNMIIFLLRKYVLILISCMLLLVSISVLGDDYDPLITPSETTYSIMDMSIHDKTRARKIPIRIYLPVVTDPSPVILYSHGLGGSREESSYLGKHWAARGYTVVYLQHPGTDTGIWQSIPEWRRLKRLRAMKDAVNAENFILRVQDVSMVLEQLGKWNQMQGHEIGGRLDLQQVGMSGHSLGARTTQAVGGQKFDGVNAKFTDERIIAALPMSPSSSQGSAREAFGTVSIPWMLITGTKDTAPFGNSSDAKSRLAVFPALPPGGKYELVLFDAEHSAFTDKALKPRSEPRNSNYHRVILAFSTAFWDAYLRADIAAKDWLDGEGPKSVLQAHDSWQKK
jgi:predicted dienelactone hydrolase